ncbi:MAG: dimethylmenaquinone methyltransferase [Actinomycetota bacterium]|nr:MAG: dimethylmenaquinone methyltransferase [Actinomycetota bacterium]
MQLAGFGTATVHEAAGGIGLVDAEFRQIVPGSRAAGPARIAYCGQNDNRAVHEIMAHVQPGDVLILTMPEPTPVALFGELMAVQAYARKVAAVLVDAAVRDIEELKSIGLPVWARFIRIRGTTKNLTLGIDVPVTVAGTYIHPGDAIILDSDGVVAIPASDINQVIAASKIRVTKEAEHRIRMEAGELSFDIYGYRK